MLKFVQPVYIYISPRFYSHGQTSIFMIHRHLLPRVIVLAALALASCAAKNPVVTVEGGKIQGTIVDGVAIYKGIPYAAPPVGELRWKGPQPVTPWDGVRICDHFGAPSWQPNHVETDGYMHEFFFDGDPEFSEDCLYLNVWAPAKGKDMPVTLWIHGGAFSYGWGFEPEMDGEEWAKHGGILVSCNYRLGLLGFLAHPLLSEENPDGISGNYGLLDQIAALKWVKNNISAFGGDPSNITIMGQSAGAMSVKDLVTSPLSKDLVAGAIIQSGGGLMERSLLGDSGLKEYESLWKDVFDWAGYTTLEQMRSINPQELLHIAGQYSQATGKFTGFPAPVVDGIVLPESFDHAAIEGRIADVPYLIGFTRDDMRGLTDGIVRFCTVREQSGKRAYAYQFARRLPDDGRPGILTGAFHSSELWYMFKSLRLSWRPFTPGDYALAEEMISAWTSFAATGKPSASWTPCTAEGPSFMVFKLDSQDAVASAMGTPLER